MSPRAPSPPPRSPQPDERRRNRTLREVLEELITHVRAVTRNAQAMTPGELDYAQQRLDWLADEVWRAALRGDDDSI